MPRRPRIQFPGAFYHVFSRGNRRAKTFWRHADYQKFVELLYTSCSRDQIRLYAWCLMPNHFHLLIQTVQNWKPEQKVLPLYARIAKESIAWKALINTVCRVFKISEQSLRQTDKNRLNSRARQMLVSIGKDHRSASLSEMGMYLQRRPSTISEMANKADQSGSKADREKVLAQVRSLMNSCAQEGEKTVLI